MMPVRIAVTGVNGQVVRSLVECGMKRGHVVLPVGRPLLDLARGDAEAIRAALELAGADLIVSAAAYTAVDKAESEPEQARAINAVGAGQVARAASALGVPLIHLSTDYVFSGEGNRAWREDDRTGPKGTYGLTKLAGENAVRAACPNSAILRTAWVYSPFGANFVKTMLRLAASHDQVGVVADQFGNPTSALDIAEGILSVAANLLADSAPDRRGLFHMAGRGETSWADFAEAIFHASAERGGPTAAVRHIPTSEYPTPAVRPSNSRLDCTRLAQVHNVRLPHWQTSLATVIDRLVDPEGTRS